MVKTYKQPSNIGFGILGPKEEDLYKCIHCGFCLSACPTYIETGAETESPRGRIALMKAINENKLPLTSTLIKHWDLCLQCRACETACPSGVPYGKLMEATKADIATKTFIRPRKRRIVSKVSYRWILTSPRRTRIIGNLLKLYIKSGLQNLVRKLNILKILPWDIAHLDKSLPSVSSFFVPRGQRLPAIGKTVTKVTMLTGCVMSMTHSKTLQSAIEVLRINGVEVYLPANQGCCGALNFHAGELDSGIKMARRNINALLAGNPDAIITTSAGCGATMKEYAHIVGITEDTQKVNIFCEKVKDIHEFLVTLPLVNPKGTINSKVAYQDACHLVHAQKISLAPRQILDSIPGITRIEIQEPLVCCGSAGTYSITEKEMSARLGIRKANNIISAGADIVATGNPGCAIQLQQWLNDLANPVVRVKFVVDLLHESYKKGQET